MKGAGYVSVRPEVGERSEREAHARGVSVTFLLETILAEPLGLPPPSRRRHYTCSRCGGEGHDVRTCKAVKP